MRLSTKVYLVGSKQVGISDIYDCHVYLLDGGEEKALVDSGMGREPEIILRNIREHGFEPSQITHIFITHAHADHAGGAKALSSATGAKVVASEYEANLMERGSDEELGINWAKASGIFPEDYEFTHCPVSLRVKDEEEVRVGELSIKALIVPGHTPGSTCYYLRPPEGPILFTGDTVFYDGLLGLLNLDNSDLKKLRQAISRLAKLEVEGFYPGHGMFMIKKGGSQMEIAARKLKSLYVPRCMGQWE